jgi:hypothetical protein
VKDIRIDVSVGVGAVDEEREVADVVRAGWDETVLGEEDATWEAAHPGSIQTKMKTEIYRSTHIKYLQMEYLFPSIYILFFFNLIFFPLPLHSHHLG